MEEKEKNYGVISSNDVASRGVGRSFVTRKNGKRECAKHQRDAKWMSALQRD